MNPSLTEALPAERSRRTQSLRTALLLLGDFSAFPVAWVLAVVIATWLGRSDSSLLFPLSTASGALFSAGSVLAIVLFAGSGQYTQRASYWEEVRVLWRNLALLALFNFSLSFFIQVSYTRTVVALAWIFTLLLVPLARLAARELLNRLGAWKLPTLVVGDGAYAMEACAAIASERHLGLRVTAIASVDAPRQPPLEHGGQPIPVYPLADGLEALALRLGCQTIVIALEEGEQSRLAALVGALQPGRFEIFVVPPISGLPVQGLQAQHFLSNDTLFLRLQQNLFKRRSRILKRGLDLVLSLLGLVALSPLLAWVAFCIWREDGGPVLFSQPRLGIGGRPFQFIKFRSMVKNADAALEAWKVENPQLYARYHAANFKLSGDPRILKTGGWIRRTSIDELPQLWNVLRGEMSLVGPRPLLPRELPWYPAGAIGLYERVRPGITGLWQVSGRSETTFEQRAVLDGWYVRNWSLWLDWVILLKTLRVVVSGRGAM